MTEAKQKAIQDAYGEYWGFVKNHVCEDGWIRWSEISPSVGYDKELELKMNGNYWRPLSLQGIADNRGWTKIESGLPEDAGKYWVVIGGEILLSNFHSNTNQWYSIENYIRYFPTHYQPIVKPQPPIY